MKKDNWNISVFDKNAEEYDEWYDRNADIFKAEIKAIKKLFNFNRSNSIEIGCGTGRFSKALNIKTAIEPSLKAAQIASDRGINVIVSKAEKTPFNDESFDSVILVFVLEFVEKPLKVLKEINRIIKRNGKFIIGFINKNLIDEKLIKEKKFYKKARFFTLKKIKEMLIKTGFKIKKSNGIIKRNKKSKVILNDKIQYADAIFVLAVKDVKK